VDAANRGKVRARFDEENSHSFTSQTVESSAKFHYRALVPQDGTHPTLTLP
jgi:hypothetical protein